MLNLIDLLFAIEAAEGDVSIAAELLNVSRSTLYAYARRVPEAARALGVGQGRARVSGKAARARWAKGGAPRV